MGIWSIYRNSGQAPNMIAVCDSLEYHGEWMGDCFLTVSVKSPTPVTFRVGDYVEYRGEKYYIDYDPNTIKKAESGTYKEGFTYDGIKLYSEFHALSDIVMKDYVLNDNGLAYSQQANFSFFASSVEDLADRIQANLDKATKGQNWKVVTPNADRSEYRNGGTDITASERRKYYGASPDGGYRDVNVVCNSIMLTDAVKMAYDLFGLSFIVTDRRIIIGGTPQPVSSSLSYGKGYGLYEVEKVTDESQRVVTKMYAYGSSDNLPLNYYANLHKQYKATVFKVDKSNPQYYYCEFTLRMSYKPSMFTEVCKWTDSSGNTYNNMGYVVKIKLGSTEITARVNNPKDSTDGLVHIYAEYVAGSEDPSDEQNQAKMSAFITSLTAGQTIYFTAGIDKNRWPTSGIDYGDSANYPALLSISNLMLPGFPDQSLYEWVSSHGGTDLNESSGKATWKGHTAYFSKEVMSPWIMSVNADTLGEREGAVYFDGSSNDTENIHPTIESTGGNVVTYGSSITDNGYLADNTDLSFSIEITAAGDLDWRELYNSRQEDAYLNMKSGYCTGRAFKMLSLPKKTGSSWTMKLERSKDGSLDRYFPYQDMSATYSKYAQIRANDTFVATGIQLPKAYVDAASEKLLEAALERLEAIDHPKQTYIPKIDELWAARDYDKKHTSSSDKSLYTNIYPGMSFSFEDADVLGAGVTMTRVIDSLTIKEDGNNGIPTFDVVLREEKEETFEQRVQSQVSSGSSGGGKSSSGQGITEDDIDSYVDGMMKVDMFSKLFEVHGKIKNGELDVNGTDTKIGYKDWKKVFDDDDAKWKEWEQAHVQDKKPYESLLNIKAKRGLWSEFFISALGVGGSGSGTPFELNELLNSLNNIKSLPTTVGHTIVWNGSGWDFDKAGGGDELGDVLQNIKDNSPNPGDRAQYKTLEYDGTNWKYGYLLRRLNVTNHKEDETTGYPTIPVDITGPQSEINLYQILNDYLKQDDADDRYVKIDWFKSLFKVHTGANDAAGTEIEPNKDLPSDGGFNIESLVGFWTKKWVSALGANGSGSGGGTPFELGPILADINLSPLQPTAAGALYYNGSAGSWSFVQLNQGIDETALQNYLDDKKYIKAAADTKWWGQTMGSDKLVKGDMTDVGDFTTAKGKRFFAKVDSSNFEFLSPYWTDSRTYLTYAPGGLVIRHGDSNRQTAMFIDDSRNVGIGTESPSVKLDVNGYAYANRFYLQKPDSNGKGAIYLEFDGNSNTPGVHLVGAGLWSDSYISALGSNPTQGTGFDPNRLVASLNDSTLEPLGVSGKVLVNNNGTWSWEDYGAGGGLDEGAMWAALGGTSDNKKIDNSHLSLNSLTFKAGASDTTGVAYSPTDNADKTITFDAVANSGISVSRNSNTITIGNTEISGLTEGSYTKVTVDKYGRVTAGEKPTTLEGYGITDALTDAKIKSDYTWWGQQLQTTNNKTEVKGILSNATGIKLNNTGTGFGYIDFHYASSTSFTSNIYEYASSKLRINGVLNVVRDGNVGIGTTEPACKLDVNGTTNATEFRVGDNYITTQDAANKYLKIVTDKNEFVIAKTKDTNETGDSKTLHINYRAVTESEKAGITDYQWHAGTSMSWASHRVGRLYLYKEGDASSDRDVYFEIDKNGDVKLNGNFYATGAVSALGSKSSGGQDTFNADLMWRELAKVGSNKIDNSHLDLSDYALLTDLDGYVKSIKVGDQTKTPNANGLVDLGSIAADGYVTPIAAGQVNTAKGDSKVWFKRASVTSDETPNNGFVIEYGNSTNWVGQLYVGDNATQGLYWNGWSNGVRGSWKKIAFTSDLDGYAKISDFKILSIKAGQNAVTTYKPSAESSITFKAGTNISLDTTTPNQIEIKLNDLSGTYALKEQLNNYLPLTGGTLSNSVNVKYASIDATKNGNNVSSTQYPTSFSILDSGGRIITRTESVVEPESNDGKISWYSYVRQYDSTHTTNSNFLAQRGIKYTLSKSLVGTWNIDDAPSFRTALGINLDKLVTTDTAQTITGEKTFNGAIGVLGGLTPIAAGHVNEKSGSNKLWIKMAWASSDGTPNNGFVLENGGGNWVGRLYIGGNGQEGLYFGGVYAGEQQPWKKLAFQSELSNYLPLAGGVMTGAIQFNSKGNNSIYNGPNDVANAAGGALGNLVISSWYGVSFTTSSSGTPYTGTNAVSINCRSGDLHVGGTINTKGNIYCRKPNGGLAMYVGHLAGEAVRIEAFDSNGNWKAKGLTLLQNGNIGIGTDSPQYKLHVNGYTYTSRLYLADGVYLEKTTDGVHLVGAGFYSDSFVSALGSNPDTPGGGGGVIELTGILGSLHDSTTALSTGALYYNGSTWSFQTLNQGDNLSEPLKSINNVGSPGTGKKMLYSNGGSWGYMDVPDKYAKELNVGTGNDDKKIRLKLNDNTYSSYITVPYASNAGEASSANTATSAGKLSDATAYKAWGHTFFTGGKPQNVSGRLSMVSADIYWNENGYGDQFAIVPSFGGETDSNMLCFMSATGGAGTEPSMTTKMVITGLNGNVGIGTVSPDAKLHVAGTLKVNGHVAINNAVLDTYWLYVDGNIRATQSSWLPSVHLFADSSNSTPYIDFHYGHTETDFTTRIIEKNSGTLSITAKTGATGLVVGNETANDYIQIGGAKLRWTGTALECDKDFYSTGAVSALGSNTSSGGGGISDISVAAILSGTRLTINVSGQTDSVDLSPISGTSGDYIPLSGSDAITGDLKPASGYNELDLGNDTNKWRYIYLSGFASVGSLKSSGICIDCSTNGYVEDDDNNYTGEINNFGGKLHLQYSSNSHLVLCGNENKSNAVVIGENGELINGNDKLYVKGNSRVDGNLTLAEKFTTNTTYKLYVDGQGFFAKAVYFGTGYSYIQTINTQSGGQYLDLWGYSGVHANGNSVTSDIRQKNIVKYVTEIKVDDIAKSPIFDFTWKRMDADKTIHTGTSAQYWMDVLPNTVSDMGEYGLSLDYGATALAAAVFTARKVVDHELRIKQLEQENAILRKEIEELKAA